jgi:AraC family transcriptional regulator
VALIVNPPARDLGTRNAVLWGRGRSSYHVHNFTGPLSIKAVLKGEARWTTSAGIARVDSTSLLVVNDGENYSIDIDEPKPVETFCVFFERGWLSPAAEFSSRVQPADAEINRLLLALRNEHASHDDAWIEDVFVRLAMRLGHLHRTERARSTRIPAARASTREELHRRVLVGRSYIEDCLAGDLRLATIAKAAAMSPFHFHRAFAAIFGETPQRYLSRRRLERAARLLAETDRPVTDICLECGFDSVGTFGTTFRRRFGCTPVEFRKREEARLLVSA